MSFLILRHVVVTLFAFCTCQCDSNAHNFHLAFSFFSTTAATLSNFRHKKKAFASSIRLHIITYTNVSVKAFFFVYSENIMSLRHKSSKTGNCQAVPCFHDPTIIKSLLFSFYLFQIISVMSSQSNISFAVRSLIRAFPPRTYPDSIPMLCI